VSAVNGPVIPTYRKILICDPRIIPNFLNIKFNNPINATESPLSEVTQTRTGDFLNILPRGDDPEFPAKYSRVYNKNGHKCVYLTFDDGPSNLTPKILDVLKKCGVHATFFVIGNRAVDYPVTLKRASEEGNLIANHSYCHVYKELYASPEAFKADILKTQEIIKNIVGAGHLTNLMRMPGGAYPSDKDAFKKAANDIGMVYIDWNAENGDGHTNHLTVAESEANVERFAKTKEDMVLLMHDAPVKETTYESLEYNIQTLKKYGFEFKLLNQYDQ